MIRGLVVTAASLLAVGCGASYPSPFTADEMAKVGDADALVHYLGQPGATASVCDRGARGPRFHGSSNEDFEAITTALLDGSIAPDLWQRCATLMLESLPPAASSRLLEAVVRGERKQMSRGAVESDARERAKLEALHRVSTLRPNGVSPRAEMVADDVAALREALAHRRLGPVASRYGQDVLVMIDLERGYWRGKKLSVEKLDELQAQKDEPTLRRIAAHVSDPSLRDEARRRIVRLHIAASRARSVHEHASDVEALVLRTGRNAIDVGKTPPASAWIDQERVHVRGVLVRQDVWKQTAKLLAYEGSTPGASVIPSLGLRGAFFARVPGYDDPLTLCAPADALDVTPCIAPADLHPKVPIVYVDAEGLLHFVERVASADAMRLVYNTPNLPLPFEIAGQTLLTIEWPIVFERPEPMVFEGPASGRGPDLHVKVERRYSPRVVFEVAAAGRKMVGVVEAADVASFAIVTRGGAGSPGTPGSDGANGSPGSPGMSASCPGSPAGNGGSGGNGGNGTNGGPGGPGGPGGDVVANVACTTGDCRLLATVVGSMVRSEGGPGGPGGEGGRGGQGGEGGAGGSGTSCTDSEGHSTYLSSGSSGMRGSDGSPGARGSNGVTGKPGRAEIRVAE